MDPIIQVQHLCKTFQVKGNVIDAAKEISFDIERGDIFGIIGLSGAGNFWQVQQQLLSFWAPVL